MKRIIYLSLLVGLLISPTVSAAEKSLEDVITEVNPSVVSIVVDTENEEQALGAGIIISEDGYIVTNAHVCDEAAKITVITTDDDEFSAELVGQDDKTDIALLKIHNQHTFMPAEFADSHEVKVGNRVFAVGNPFGLGNSVSLGIISAKERDIERGPYDNFLQTDASINQGNSGGPLFNLDGKIVGMNTAIFSTDGQYMGVGFATPSDIVRWVIGQLQNNKRVVRSWLGLAVQKIHSDDEKLNKRLHIVSMSEDSPALKAGMKVGDVLLQAADIDVSSPRLFSLGIAQTAPETEIPFKLLRDGNILEIKVKVKEMPEEKPVLQEGFVNDMPQNHRGTYYAELGLWAYYDETAQEFVVEDVAPGSDAARKGISRSDRFKSVNEHKVFGEDDLRIKIKQAAQKGKLTLQINGSGEVNIITLNLRAENEQN